MNPQSQIVRINCRTHAVSFSDLAPEKSLWGGRRLTSHIICQEVPPTCHALGPNNKLVLACGPLAGSLVSSVNRLSIGAKSPLTGGIKESNAGGTSAYMMGRLNIRALVLEDCPINNDVEHLRTTSILVVSKNGVRFDDGEHLRGMGVYARAKRLFADYGSHVGISLIGPMGDMLLHSAGITNADPEGSPSRYNGRGGLGAVMGSKGLAAIVYDASGTEKNPCVDQAAFTSLYKPLAKTLTSIPQITQAYKKYGTAAMVDVTSALGGLPTRNFSTGQFADKDAINGHALRETILARGGEGRTSHACMKGCLIQCSNVFADATGKAVCSPVEYENLGLLGSNLCIGNLDHVAELNYLCNDLGCDTIEMGAALGVAMAAGVLPFGNFEAARDALEEIRQGTALGRVLGSGAGTVGKVFGCRHVPTVKNQALAAYEPRAFKGLGVTYATSTQGADHTSGNVVRNQLEHHKKDGQVAAVQQAQVQCTVMDSLGFCLFLGAAIDWEHMCKLIAAKTGHHTSLEALRQAACQTLLDEKAFNTQAGLGPEHDCLPEYMYLEKNPVSDEVFDFSPAELAEVMHYKC